MLNYAPQHCLSNTEVLLYFNSWCIANFVCQDSDLNGDKLDPAGPSHRENLDA